MPAISSLMRRSSACVSSRCAVLLALVGLGLSIGAVKAHQEGSTELDVLIPIGPRDVSTLPSVVCSTLRWVGVHDIYVVGSNATLTHLLTVYPDSDRSSGMYFRFANCAATVKWLREEEILAEYLPGEEGGWGTQQVLKLIAPVVFEMRANVLVVDCDVTWRRKVHFFDEHNRTLLSQGGGFDIVQYHDVPRLMGGVMSPPGAHLLSGVSHHAVFNREILLAMFCKIVSCDVKKFAKFWANGARQGTADDILKAFRMFPSASEYQMYFQYALSAHGDKVAVRDLAFAMTCNALPPYAYDYDVCHHHFRSGQPRAHWDSECANFCSPHCTTCYTPHTPCTHLTLSKCTALQPTPRPSLYHPLYRATIERTTNMMHLRLPYFIAACVAYAEVLFFAWCTYQVVKRKEIADTVTIWFVYTIAIGEVLCRVLNAGVSFAGVYRLQPSLVIYVVWVVFVCHVVCVVRCPVTWQHVVCRVLCLFLFCELYALPVSTMRPLCEGPYGYKYLHLIAFIVQSAALRSRAMQSKSALL